MEKGTQLLSRATDILSLLQKHNEQGLGVTEIARSLDFSGPTTHRILQALMASGLVWQLPSGRRYVLGPACCLLGQTAVFRFNMLPLIEAAIQKVAEATGDTVFFFLRQGRTTRCITRRSGDFPVKSHVTEVGAIRPLGLGAGGLAILSALDPKDATEILRENVGDYTAAGRSLAEIEADLERTRKAQLAIRHLPTLNVTTISLPLSNKLGRTIGALSLSAISPRMSGEHLLTAVEHLREAGRVIARDVELDEHVLSQLIPT